MSYDLAVYAATRLDRVQLEALVRGAGLDVEPGSRSSDSFTVLRGVTGRYCFDMGEPDLLEPEDVPGDVARIVAGPRWLYHLMVEGSSPTEIPHAVEVARRLAEATDGAVVDGRQVRARGRVWEIQPTPYRYIDVVEVTWYTREADQPSHIADIWLRLARQFLPAALPRRYGQFEPLAGRLDRDGDAAFTAVVNAPVGPGTPGTVYFTAASPCILGHLRGPAAQQRIKSHQLSLHREELRQPHWREALRRLFVEFALSSHAFYASAEVLRRCTWSDNTYNTDATTERATFPVVRGRWWGLPPYPVWWSWFGPDYVPLVAGHLTTGRVTGSRDGLLHEGADEPADRDELARAGGLPEDLLARPGTSDPTVSDPRVESARTIPAALRDGDDRPAGAATRHAIGLEVRGGELAVLIPAGRPLPATQTELFTTADDDQRSVTIRIMRDDHPTAQRYTPLGEYEISGFRPAPRGETRIGVTFRLDLSENLTITAEDLNTRAQAVVRRQS